MAQKQYNQFEILEKVPSDIAIAQKVVPLPIDILCQKVGIRRHEVDLHGPYKAKVRRERSVLGFAQESCRWIFSLPLWGVFYELELYTSRSCKTFASISAIHGPTKRGL